jgi:purine-cytosine permease-like protein
MYTHLKFVQGDYYMNNKNTGMIATIATVVLCGCPGLFMCLFGAITATGNGSFNEEALSPAVGIALVCVALIFVLIPVAVGFFTLRKQPDVVVVTNEPTPPTEL